MEMTNVLSQEYMDTMAQLMSQAVDSDEGLNALAQALLPPIEMEIERKEISSLLLTKHALPAGQPVKYVKRKGVKRTGSLRKGKRFTVSLPRKKWSFLWCGFIRRPLSTSLLSATVMSGT